MDATVDHPEDHARTSGPNIESKQVNGCTRTAFNAGPSNHPATKTHLILREIRGHGMHLKENVWMSSEKHKTVAFRRKMNSELSYKARGQLVIGDKLGTRRTAEKSRTDR